MSRSPEKSKTLAATLLLLSFSFGLRAESFNFNPLAKKQPPPVTGPTASLQSATLIHDKWAVVIGVSNFKDPAIAPIKYGAESANKLGTLLLDPAYGHFKPDHLVLLQQDDAKKETVDDVLLSGVVSKALPSDMIVIYLSTRWMPSKDGKGIVFCCNDTTVANPDGSGMDLVATLSAIRRRTQCKNILCLLDLSPLVENTSTDHLLTNAPKTKGQELDIVGRLSALTNVSVFSANGLVTSSAQTPFTETSYFTRFLMENIKGSGGGMTSTLMEHAVTDQVHATVLSEQKIQQIPLTTSTADWLPNLAVGAIVGKPRKGAEIGGIPSNVRIGIDHTRMPIDHPEMLEGSGIGTPVHAPPPERKHVVAQLPQSEDPMQSTYSGSKEIRKRVEPNQAPPTIPQKTEKPQTGSPVSQADDDDSDQPAADLDLRPYIASAKKLIQAKWQPVKGLENHKVITEFTILRDGTIQQAEITEPSGIKSVDQAALDALKAASPLPPLPTGSPRSIRLRYKFEWKVTRN